jgi:hypothetical protein
MMDRPTQPAPRQRPVLAWISLAAAGLLVALLVFSARGQRLALHGIVRLPDPSRPPSPEIANLTLNALAMAAPDDGWAFATYYIPPRTNADGSPLGPPQTRTAMLRYDGNAWRLGADAAPSYYINSISMVSREDGWAAGYGGLLHYSAGRWNPVTLPASPATPTPNGPQYANSFQTIEMVAADEGWAAGNGVFYHYHGGAWAPVSIPVSAAQYSIFDLSMRGADEGWAVGEQFDAQDNRSILALHYAGGRWTAINPGARGTLTGVAAAAPGEAWAVGAVDPAVGPGMIPHYAAGQWTRAPSPTTNILDRVAMLSPSEGWAVGDGAVTLRYTGGAWTKVGAGIHGVRLNALALTSASDGWATGASVTGDGAVLLHYTRGAWTPYPMESLAAQLRAQAG